MLLKKKSGPLHADKVVDVVVEPAPDVSDEEVVELLETLGADDVEVLDERYISARGKRSLFAQLGPKATVHEKTEQQLHAD